MFAPQPPFPKLSSTLKMMNILSCVALCFLTEALKFNVKSVCLSVCMAFLCYWHSIGVMFVLSIIGNDGDGGVDDDGGDDDDDDDDDDGNRNEDDDNNDVVCFGYYGYSECDAAGLVPVR